jgi:hypothetical protein
MTKQRDESNRSNTGLFITNPDETDTRLCSLEYQGCEGARGDLGNGRWPHVSREPSNFHYRIEGLSYSRADFVFVVKYMYKVVQI